MLPLGASSLEWLRWIALLMVIAISGLAAAAVPTVTNILPPNGYSGGGTAVTIVGSGFTGATKVTIGGVAVTSLTVVTDGMINATTGPHAAGAVGVAVTTPGGSVNESELYVYGALQGGAGASWTDRSSAGTRIWGSIACSADGSKLVAGEWPGNIWTSSDGGGTWTKRPSAGSRDWVDIASSADGNKLAAVVGTPGDIWTSADGGASWTDRSSAGTRYWFSIASSADGSKLAAVHGNGGHLWTSTDSGATWIERSGPAIGGCTAIASSADGSKLAAVEFPGFIWTSTDGGATWTKGTSAGSRAWFSIACSADGSKLAAVANSSGIWTSTDGGAAWTERTSADSRGWWSIVCSADGSRLAAVANSGDIWTSPDGGATWTDRTNAGSRTWQAIASAADGSKLAAAVTNGGDIWTSGPANLTGTVPSVNIIPASASLNLGSSVTLTANLTSGMSPFTYAWRRNGVKIKGATGITFTLSNAQQATAGSYDVQVTNSIDTTTAMAASVTVSNPVIIVFPPLPQEANVGDAVTLGATVTGTGPLYYQWRFNTIPLINETNPTLSFTADASKSGVYDVVVTNVVGSVTSKPAAVRVLSPPVITSAPADQRVNAGAQAQFSVTAMGDSLSYQWRRNGVALAGKTGALLLLSNVQTSNQGSYDVVVKNSYGTVISPPAVLQLAALLEITSQPADMTANVDQIATFSVTATGPSMLTYQWYKNGQAVAGEKSASLSVLVADGSAAGIYTVMVTSGTSKATSTPATLRVNDSGLLVYNVTASGAKMRGVVSAPVTVTGTLILDRIHQRGAFVWFGKNGISNTFRTEINENLRCHSTGPVASSVTVVSRVTENGIAPDTNENLLWLKGSDSLLTLSPSDKTVGPQTMVGTLNSLVLDEGAEVETLSITGVLDAVSSSQARQTSETVERTINRLAAALQYKGYVRQ